MKNKILIVEDSISDIVFLKKALENEDYNLNYAENGKDALTLIKNDTPDLVILDILLPDIDGYEVCRRIRNNDSWVNLPILFYSAIKTVDEKLLGLKMGASEFLSKSADNRELLARIRNLLKTKKKIDTAIASSFYDPLTNVYSPQYFEHRINDECMRSRRYKRNLSCVLMDVDKFQIINNTFGTHTGDRTLRKIAEIIQQNIRSADEVCRYKEDEFAVLMPETNLREAYAIAERVRQYLCMSDDLRNECTVDLTVSCGVSFYGNNVKDTNELISQASDALKQAKQEGSNQTKFYQL